MGWAPVSRQRLVAAVTVALLLVAGACGDDGDDGGSASGSTTSSTRKSTTTESTTTDKPGPTVTIPADAALKARLPAFEGYKAVEQPNQFDQKRCDGKRFTTIPSSQANASYTSPSGQEGALTVVALAFPDEATASTFYKEFALTASECGGDRTVLSPEKLDFGDEALLFPTERNGSASGAFVIARKGNVVWYLNSLGGGLGQPIRQDVLDTLKSSIG